MKATVFLRDHISTVIVVVICGEGVATVLHSTQFAGLPKFVSYHEKKKNTMKPTRLKDLQIYEWCYLR